MHQKRFANVLIVGKKKEVYLADNMEDFELHEYFFYINTSSFSNEKGNSEWHLLSGPVKLMKASQPKPYPTGK